MYESIKYYLNMKTLKCFYVFAFIAQTIYLFKVIGLFMDNSEFI